MDIGFNKFRLISLEIISVRYTESIYRGIEILLLFCLNSWIYFYNLLSNSFSIKIF